jgi:hypothetical protein
MEERGQLLIAYPDTIQVILCTYDFIKVPVRSSTAPWEHFSALCM